MPLSPDAPKQIFNDGRGAGRVAGDEKGNGVGLPGIAIIERRQGGRVAPGDKLRQRIVRQALIRHEESIKRLRPGF